MDLQEMMDNAVQASRQERFKQTDQLTLGELTVLFQNVPGKLPVVFDDGEMCPTGLGSWRGSYRELAIRYEEVGSRYPMTSSEFLSLLNDATNGTFTGYKGGEYEMGQQTPVWVANYGENYGFDEYEHPEHQGVVGVEGRGDVVAILTDGVEF